MTSEPRRLLAVAISPLSYLGGTAPSAIEVVHNLKFTRSDGSAWRGEAKLRLSGDRSTLALSMRDSGVGPGSVEIWKLTEREGEGRQARRNGFLVVILQRLQEAGPGDSMDLAFDLSQASTMSGCIDVGDLRRLGFPIPHSAQSVVEGLGLAPAVSSPAERPASIAPAVRQHRQPKVRRRSQGSARKTMLHTGSFAKRSELTARIWALRRQQMFPNLAAIARECGTSPEVVRVVVAKQEGLDRYLQAGCLLG